MEETCTDCVFTGTFLRRRLISSKRPKRARRVAEPSTNSFATVIKSSLSVRFLWMWSTMMLLSRCWAIVICKYDFARRIALNDRSLVAFVAAAASTNLAKCMTCSNSNFMPGNKFFQCVHFDILLIQTIFDAVDYRFKGFEIMFVVEIFGACAAASLHFLYRK